MAFIHGEPMKTQPFLLLYGVVLTLAGFLGSCASHTDPDSGRSPETAGESEVEAKDPLDSIYTLEGRNIHLTDGRFEAEAAPGSASKIRTTVFGDPVHGDLNGDDYVDAALFLVYDAGGSGTFYYLAAAIHKRGMYHGTNAVLLGDRITPESIRIRNGVITADYIDRQSGQSMATHPTSAKSSYLILEAGELKEIKALGVGEQVVDGWVTVGHEVRSFAPCRNGKDLWILGNSPALNGITAAHREILPDRRLYAPLFMTLAGTFAENPGEGFGETYDGGFYASQLVQVWPAGNCKSDRIVLDAPSPGIAVTSPLVVRGHARGTWFFEGDFPLLLKDSRGNIISERYASAKGEWMTREFVPFEGTLEFEKQVSGDSGILILKKDNPTGKPEFDDSLEIPVSFH
jgi:hypothetical protein